MQHLQSEDEELTSERLFLFTFRLSFVKTWARRGIRQPLGHQMADSDAGKRARVLLAKALAALTSDGALGNEAGHSDAQRRRL